MVVELILVLGRDALSLTVHLGHLLEGVKDGRDHALVFRADDAANGKCTRAFELAFDALDEELRANLGQPRSNHQSF